MSAGTQAKRGDLCVIEYRGSHHDGDAPSFELERVVAVTRDGLVKATIRAIPSGHGNYESREPLFRTVTRRGRQCRDYRLRYWSTHLVPAATIDVEPAWAMWMARDPRARFAHWGITVATLDEMRDLLRPYLRTTQHPGDS